MSGCHAVEREALDVMDAIASPDHKIETSFPPVPLLRPGGWLGGSGQSFGFRSGALRGCRPNWRKASAGAEEPKPAVPCLPALFAPGMDVIRPRALTIFPNRSLPRPLGGEGRRIGDSGAGGQAAMKPD